MKPQRPTVKAWVCRVPLLALCFSTLALAQPATTAPAPDLWEGFARAWQNNPAWADGRRECAEYQALHTIAGQFFPATARAVTYKMMSDPQTKNRAADPTAPGLREVFVRHLRQDIPSPAGVSHLSALTFVAVGPLKSLRIDMGIVGDEGTTFKQFINHRGTLTWEQFNLAIGQGHQSGSYQPPADFGYLDAMTTVLRGYPAQRPLPAATVRLVAGQVSDQLTPPDPQPWTLTYRGPETLALPIGSKPAHRLTLEYAGLASQAQPAVSFWIAAEPDLLGLTLQYESTIHRVPVTYRLQALRWENPQKQ